MSARSAFKHFAQEFILCKGNGRHCVLLKLGIFFEFFELFVILYLCKARGDCLFRNLLNHFVVVGVVEEGVRIFADCPSYRADL